jgi:5-methylcytosine-specific restriction endonuclease McrA
MDISLAYTVELQETPVYREVVYNKTRGYCKYCCKKLTLEEMVISYKVHPSRGGKNESRNLIPTCQSCHELKGLMTHIELRHKRKRLRENHKKKIKRVALKQKILDKTNGKCIYCGMVLTVESMTTDHIIPISHGGDNGLDNLVPSCLRCNNLKGSMTFDEFNSTNKKPISSFWPIASLFRRLLRKYVEFAKV